MSQRDPAIAENVAAPLSEGPSRLHAATQQAHTRGSTAGPACSLGTMKPLLGMSNAPPLAISVRSASKRFGATVVLDDVDLDVRSGEFLTLLGPSGSGKTTLLMVLAGFMRPDHGSVQLRRRRGRHALPPHKRDVGMVFQNYALFPHMNVADNIAFPLKLRGDACARNRASASARRSTLVQLAGYGEPAHRPALRRPAPARGAGARDRVRAAHPADGRAAVGARQAAARADADRDCGTCTSSSA